MSEQTKSKPLGPARLRILGMIVEYRRRHGYSPTIREVTKAVDRHFGTVLDHIQRLADDGFITRDGHYEARNYAPTAKAEAEFPIRFRMPLGAVGADWIAMPKAEVHS